MLAPRFRCIAYDQRDSGARAIGANDYPIEQMADDVAGFIAALGLRRAHVFGTSLGGVIAQELAVRHPQRVDRLVLSSAIRAGQLMTDFAPETAARLAVLRADPVANADALAAHFFPAAYLEATSRSVRIAAQRAHAGAVRAARRPAAPPLRARHSARSRARRWCWSAPRTD